MIERVGERLPLFIYICTHTQIWAVKRTSVNERSFIDHAMDAYGQTYLRGIEDVARYFER